MGEWRGFSVGGRRVVIVGGDARTLGTISALVQAQAAVLVVADNPTEAVRDLANRRLLDLQSGPWQDDRLDGAALVVTDGGDSDTAEAIEAAAARQNVIAYRLHPVDRPVRRSRTGEVVLVGGGPGDPGLLTVAGQKAIQTADVIATDRLAPLAALAQARDEAEIIDVGKIPRGSGTSQEAIQQLLIERARGGDKVVRLKGGDGFVFGRGGEEWQACAAAGIPVTVIAGVTSATAAPAAAGIPVTHRTMSQGFTVVSGHLPPTDARTMINWDALARTRTTLVIMMGMANLGAIAEHLIDSGLPADTPAIAIADGTLPSMRTVRAPVSKIANRCQEEGVGAPATVVIGPVAGFTVDAD